MTMFNPNLYIDLKNIQYLYRDQYGKSIFKVSKIDLIDDLLSKIVKYKSINPISKKSEDYYLIRFNDTKHLFKNRVNYNIIFFIHKNTNKRNDKTYINLHIQDAVQTSAKQLEKVLLKNL